MIKDKNYYRKRMNGSAGEIFRKLFTEKRKEVKRRKRKCLEKYEDNIESMITSNPKSFFAYTKA